MTNIQNDISLATLVRRNWPFGRSFRHHNREAFLSTEKYKQSRNNFTALRKIFWRKLQILKTAARRNMAGSLLSVFLVRPAIRLDELSTGQKMMLNRGHSWSPFLKIIGNWRPLNKASGASVQI